MPRLERASSDFQLSIELQEVKVGFRNTADELQDHGSPGFFACQKIAASCFIGPPDATPDVEFPGEIALEIIVERVRKAGKQKLRFPSHDRCVARDVGLWGKVHPGDE